MLAKRIKEKRKAARLTQLELGVAVGSTKSSVCNWEKGLYKPDVDTVEKIAEVLHTSAGYLLGYTDDDERYSEAEELNYMPEGWLDHFEGDLKAAVLAYRAMDADRANEVPVPAEALPIKPHIVPLLGPIHAGEPTFAEQEFDSYVETGTAIRCDYALRVVGDSMINARICDGDIVFIRKQPQVEDGEIAAVLIDDETTLKRVRYLPGGLTMFSPENPRYQPIIVGGKDETRTVRILGKAIAFQSDVR